MDDVWLRVGEVARRTGLSVRTLHHWDERGLLVPSGRSASDYRLYSNQDLLRLLRIQHLKSLGLSLDEVAAALDSDDFDAAAVLERHIEAVEERIGAEQELLHRLTRLRSAADAGWEEVLEVAALTERLRHPDAAVRFRASLEASTSTSVAELVERLATDPADGVREGLTWALARHGTAATAAVVARLADPDPRVRLQFAHVLGKLGDPTAVPHLAPLLHDEDHAVAAKAAQSLGALGGPDAAAALVAALWRTSEPEAVVSALGAIGHTAVAPLLDALREDDSLRHGYRREWHPCHSEALRARAAEALGLIGDESAASALVLALTDGSALVRYEALVALGQTPGAVAAQAIESMVDAPEARLRTVAQRLARDRRSRGTT